MMHPISLAAMSPSAHHPGRCPRTASTTTATIAATRRAMSAELSRPGSDVMIRQHTTCRGSVARVRILHTSDWHIGRTFHGIDLHEAQTAFAVHVAEEVDARGIDVVLVSGDVYDRALPSVASTQVLDRAVDGILAAGAQVVMTAGNHDSAVRLGFGSKRAEAAGLHVRCTTESVTTPVVLDHESGVHAFYALPYFDPYLTAPHFDVDKTHGAVLGAATDAVREHMADKQYSHVTVLAHAFVAGGEPSDSERDISIGGIGDVPLSLFDGFDYVALGHLHGRAVLSDRVRYSGSPLAYSFSEATHRKGSWLVDTSSETVEFIDAPVPAKLFRLTGTLSDLLESDEFKEAESGWCEVTLTDAHRPRDPMAALRKRFAHPVVVRHVPAESSADTMTYTERTQGVSDVEATKRFFDHVTGRLTTPPQDELIQAAWDAVRAADREGA